MLKEKVGITTLQIFVNQDASYLLNDINKTLVFMREKAPDYAWQKLKSGKGTLI